MFEEKLSFYQTLESKIELKYNFENNFEKNF